MIRNWQLRPAALPRLAASVIPLVVLCLAGLASVFLYWRGLEAPYGLLQNVNAARISIGNMVGLKPGPVQSYIVTWVELFALYGVALLAVHGQRDRSLLAVVIGGAAIFCIVLLLVYPMEAIDIFDYILRGRLQAVYHADPFFSTPNQFQSDLFFRYGLWNSWPSTYGPLWELIAGGASALAGNGVAANVIAFKLVEVAGYAATCVVIVRMVNRQNPGHALFALTLFAWNPLVLSSLAGNGHNDGIMVAFLVLGFYFASIRRFSLAVMAEMAGALVKFIPLLVVPVLLVAGLKANQTWKSRVTFLALTGIGCLALFGLAWLPYQHPGDLLAITRRGTLFTTSIPMFVHFYMAKSIGAEADKLVATGAAALTGLWALWQAWRVYRDDRPDAPQRAALAIFLFYLLVTCLWFQPWYVIWVIALAALVESPVMVWGAALLSVAAQAQLPLFYLILFPKVDKYPAPMLDVYETGLTLGLCWAYFAAAGVRRLVRFRWPAPTEPHPAVDGSLAIARSMAEGK